MTSAYGELGISSKENGNGVSHIESSPPITSNLSNSRRVQPQLVSPTKVKTIRDEQQTENVDIETSDEVSEEQQKLIDELVIMESELDSIHEQLEDENQRKVWDEIYQELVETGDASPEEHADDEFNTWLEMWEEELDRAEEEHVLLQEELEKSGVPLAGFYAALNKAANTNGDAENGHSNPSWKTEADKELDSKCPIIEKRGKLFERGASGFLGAKMRRKAAGKPLESDEGIWAAALSSSRGLVEYKPENPAEAVDLCLQGAEEIDELEPLATSDDALLRAALENEEENHLRPVHVDRMVHVVEKEDVVTQNEEFKQERAKSQRAAYRQRRTESARQQRPCAPRVKAVAKPRRLVPDVIADIDNGTESCSLCGISVGVLQPHPALPVKICTPCLTALQRVEFSRGEDGWLDVCVWCGREGNLLCCDYCSFSFCNGCVSRGTGDAQLFQRLTNEDAVDWKCFSCDPTSIQLSLDLSSEPGLHSNSRPSTTQRKRALQPASPAKDSAVDDPPVSTVSAKKIKREPSTSRLENGGNGSSTLTSMDVEPAIKHESKPESVVSPMDSTIESQVPTVLPAEVSDSSSKPSSPVVIILDDPYGSGFEESFDDASAAAKRGRGRPPKNGNGNSKPSSPTAKRPRGRPRKIFSPFTESSTAPTRSAGDPDRDDTADPVAAGSAGETKASSVKAEPSESGVTTVVKDEETVSKKAGEGAKRGPGRPRKEPSSGQQSIADAFAQKDVKMQDVEESDEDSAFEKKGVKRKAGDNSEPESAEEVVAKRKRKTVGEEGEARKKAEADGEEEAQEGEQEDEEDDSDEDDSESDGGGCLVCSKDVNRNKILLCDGCDAEYHTYCLTPPLKRIPRGDWFCPECTKKKKDALSLKDDKEDEIVSPTKRRKRIRKVEDDEKLNEETQLQRQMELERQQKVETVESLRRAKAAEITVIDDDSDDDYFEKKDGAIVAKPDAKAVVLYTSADKDDSKTVVVPGEIGKILKPHQVEGVKFLWDNCIESVDAVKDGKPGFGCILAHCMGLGKSIQVIAFVATILANTQLRSKIRKILILAPVNALHHWQGEFRRWMPRSIDCTVYLLDDAKTVPSRVDLLRRWNRSGGVMVVGYEMFRNLVQGKRLKKGRMKNQIIEFLQEPGADLVVADEGHIIKNYQSGISQTMSSVATKRRIALTGSPLQNNLMEYHCMVDFVRPTYLGTRSEFKNRFEQPIANGQCSDSLPRDVRLMKQRAHVLYSLLKGFVQRKDYSVLLKDLPPKHEYVLSVKLSPLQSKLYKAVLSWHKSQASSLFTSFHALMQIWNHPILIQKAMEEAQQTLKLKASSGRRGRYSDSEGSLSDFIVDTDEEESSPELTDEDEDSDASVREVKSKKKKETSKRNKKIIQSSESSAGSPSNSASGSPSNSPSPTNQGVPSPVSSPPGFAAGSSAPSMPLASSQYAATGEPAFMTQLTSYQPAAGSMNPATTVLPGGSSTAVPAQSTSPHPVDLTENDSEKDAFLKIAGAYLGESSHGAWLKDLLPKEGLDDPVHSGKMVIFLELLQLAASMNDKVVVYSQSLHTLDFIEEVLRRTPRPKLAQKQKNFFGVTDEEADEIESKKTNYWIPDLDYVRIDGSVNSASRQKLIKRFNADPNSRLRLFLLSTKAGSVGISLVAANRVVIFDASWNPAHDLQALFRVFRYGQTKPVFIYRLVAAGTMEDKIYSRQVTKEGLALRVVDSKQVGRHFTGADIGDLFTFQEGTDNETVPMPNVAVDSALLTLVTRHREEWIGKVHEHNSLLQDTDHHLTEEEKQEAFDGYNQEKEAGSRRRYDYASYTATTDLSAANLTAAAAAQFASQNNPTYLRSLTEINPRYYATPGSMTNMAAIPWGNIQVPFPTGPSASALASNLANNLVNYGASFLSNSDPRSTSSASPVGWLSSAVNNVADSVRNVFSPYTSNPEALNQGRYAHLYTSSSANQGTSSSAGSRQNQ